MFPPFDIFRVESDGHLVWKDTAETLDLARLRIKISMVSQPGDYVILQPADGPQHGHSVGWFDGRPSGKRWVARDLLHSNRLDVPLLTFTLFTSGSLKPRYRTALRRLYSCRTTVRRDLFTLISPLYSMKPSFLNLFMNRFTRVRVVPIISASVS